MTDLLFVVSVGKTIGLGHLVRSIALASYMERAYGMASAFVLTEALNGVSSQRVRSHGWSLYGCSEREGLWRCIEESAGIERPKGVIYDLEQGCPSSLECRAAGKAKIIGFIGAGEKGTGAQRLDCSFVQGLPVPPPSDKRCYYGTEYVVLREEFEQEHDAAGEPSKVFVCGGGSDPFDVTDRICKALHTAEGVRQVEVVLGSLYRGRMDDFKTKEIPRVSIYRDVENPYELMIRCCLAVVSYGMVALEALAVGLPTLAVSISEDHLASADALARRYGGLISLGLVSKVRAAAISEAVSGLLKDPELRLRMAASAKRAVDGKGAARVAHKIRETIQ